MSNEGGTFNKIFFVTVIEFSMKLSDEINFGRFHVYFRAFAVSFRAAAAYIGKDYLETESTQMAKSKRTRCKKSHASCRSKGKGGHKRHHPSPKYPCRPQKPKKPRKLCHKRKWHRCILPVVVKIKMPEGRKFLEKERLQVEVDHEWSPRLLVNSSLLHMYSFVVVNRGEHPAEVRVEISPDGKIYAKDTQAIVPSGASSVLVPARYLKYTRLNVRAQLPDQTTILDLYFQAQTAG